MVGKTLYKWWKYLLRQRSAVESLSDANILSSLRVTTSILKERQMKALLVYFKGFVKDSILGPVFKLIEASFELLVPMVIAGIVDITIPNRDQNHLFMMIFLLFGLAVIGVVVAISAQYFHLGQQLAMPKL